MVRNWDLSAAFVSVFGIYLFLFFQFVSYRFLCEILEALMAESKREREKQMEERERKWGEKKIRGPSNGKKLGPT
jgi:hypothetical protein